MTSENKVMKVKVANMQLDKLNTNACNNNCFKLLVCLPG